MIHLSKDGKHLETTAAVEGYIEGEHVTVMQACRVPVGAFDSDHPDALLEAVIKLRQEAMKVPGIKSPKIVGGCTLSDELGEITRRPFDHDG